MTYHIIHSNVDGAGVQERGLPTLAAAKARANELQAQVNATGNPWLYSYTVYGSYGEHEYYQTKPVYNAALAAAHFGHPV